MCRRGPGDVQLIPTVAPTIAEKARKMDSGNTADNDDIKMIETGLKALGAVNGWLRNNSNMISSQYASVPVNPDTALLCFEIIGRCSALKEQAPGTSFETYLFPGGKGDAVLMGIAEQVGQKDNIEYLTGTALRPGSCPLTKSFSKSLESMISYFKNNGNIPLYEKRFRAKHQSVA